MGLAGIGLHAIHLPDMVVPIEATSKKNCTSLNNSPIACSGPFEVSATMAVPGIQDHIVLSIREAPTPRRSLH